MFSPDTLHQVMGRIHLYSRGYPNGEVNPMMLRELNAFEAGWLDLKDVYPTSGQDNVLIAHAMGQLVDSPALTPG